MPLLRHLSASLVKGRLFGFSPPTPRLQDLSPHTKDIVFRWQLGAKDFNHIDHDTLLRAEICETQAFAKKVLAVCHDLGIVDRTTGMPVTAKIDRTMVSKMPVISLQKQRELVMLLFFWEEETTRWRLIGTEEAEVERLLGEQEITPHRKAELQYVLQMIKGKRRVWPSKRDQSGEVMTRGDEVLPTYEQVRAQRYD